MSLITEDLLDKELLNNEKIILSHNSAIYIDTQEYKISKPISYLNPLYARMLDGRGWDNKILYIRGKIYLTNYRIVFKAKEENFSIFSFPHDAGNALKNRLHGEIDIFLWEIRLITRFKHLTNRGLSIHTTKQGEYKFSITFVNLLKFIEEIDKAKKDITETNVKSILSNPSNKLILNERLEKHNKFWSGVGRVIGIINLPFIILDIGLSTPFYLLKAANLLKNISEE